MTTAVTHAAKKVVGVFDAPVMMCFFFFFARCVWSQSLCDTGGEQVPAAPSEGGGEVWWRRSFPTSPVEFFVQSLSCGIPFGDL